MKAVVTGASSGIGREICFSLSAMGYDIFAVARREDRLLQLKSEINTNLTPIILDLSSPENCFELYEKIKNEKIDVLINNAGIGVYGKFNDTSLEKEIQMINVNIYSLHILTKLFARKFVENGYGYIMNVSSSAAFMMGPFLSSYYASKAYVLRLSEAIDEEIHHECKNVSISILCPGPVKTEFDSVANVSSSLKGLDSRYVAQYAIKKMFKRKRIIIPGFKMKLGIFAVNFIPGKLLSKITYYIQKKKGKITT